MERGRKQIMSCIEEKKKKDRNKRPGYQLNDHKLGERIEHLKFFMQDGVKPNQAIQCPHLRKTQDESKPKIIMLRVPVALVVQIPPLKDNGHHIESRRHENVLQTAPLKQSEKMAVAHAWRETIVQGPWPGCWILACQKRHTTLARANKQDT